jgi:hypothetical protein
MKKFLMLALLPALYPAAVLAQSADCTALGALPATISQPGKYCLVQDYTVNSATVKAITIAANDVTLDCGGHTIRNLATSSAGSSEGIFANERNSITIRNCRIQGGFTNGISLLQNNAAPNRNYYITIDNNFVAGPYWHGIRVYGSAVEISNNRVYDIGGQIDTYGMGIRVAGSIVEGSPKYHLVHHNVVAGTSSPTKQAFGIYSDNSLASLFWMNDVNGTAASNQASRSYAFRIGGSVNSVRDNQIVGSPLANDTGIYATSPSTDCYDNHIRSPQPTSGCDATMGNY